jgi:RNA polymerase sigma factor (sigma-70 family)
VTTPESLFQKHIAFAHYMARLFANRRLQYAPLDDMGQDALIALWRAAQLFDDSRGLVFRTYAGRAIWNALSQGARAARRNGFTMVGDRVATPALGGDALDLAGGRADRDPLEAAELWAAVGELPPTSRDAVVAYYRDGVSNPVTAGRERVTKEAVRQRVEKGIKLLRERFAGPHASARPPLHSGAAR